MKKMKDEEFKEHLMDVFPEEAFQNDCFNYHPTYLIEGLINLSLKAQEIEQECEEEYPSYKYIIYNTRCLQACINFIGFMIDKDTWNKCLMNKIDIEE